MLLRTYYSSYCIVCCWKLAYIITWHVLKQNKIYNIQYYNVVSAQRNERAASCIECRCLWIERRLVSLHKLGNPNKYYSGSVTLLICLLRLRIRQTNFCIQTVLPVIAVFCGKVKQYRTRLNRNTRVWKNHPVYCVHAWYIYLLSFMLNFDSSYYYKVQTVYNFKLNTQGVLDLTT